MTILSKDTFPLAFEDEIALEDFMTLPSQALIDDLARLEGDIMILGVGGKMGPTLARLAKRAAPDKRVIGVARFTDPAVADKLQSWGVETITCDLLDEAAVSELPQIPNIIFMAGRKFGTTGSEELTWAMNVEVPAIVAKTFTNSRVVVFSTGCVYPFVSITSGGASEDTPPLPPAGEYAYSCLGRERMFDYFSRQNGNSVLMYRLNYAIDMRYGVLYDIASKVWNEEAIDLGMGHVNVIWQGDAISQALRCLHLCENPASVLNVSGAETLEVKSLAEAFGSVMGKKPQFTGTPAPMAWLSNTEKAVGLFGLAVVDTDTMIGWVADWVSRGQASLGKPTHYEARDGSY
ncbi:MAG: NAD-dependent epimerase/dehydratase family protein [Alphaproteobacteria bacterium]|jgi:nucleoside-diphosphate-sugar epimerase|nr:NAD-dependent epimerase/dehydratase family protein [Alphaproteobacteria bacterium]MBT4086284.1 NAD-dependent epimerase/dehydratase family protein [Alphaproteobacteria bacterium]MBT4543901.1 NAD-dependent epimerase/dehydratase family protein [Alphaproteobacteria bacterium]MBT6385221.1 NAD-dependent epimerase/dehydratase family protein [Alphaproteobacteria bacterium]MBT7745270.1 NAD-dependent epimerase/dehydratase family protein [Alphaproteobacteria bacterium]